MDDILIPGKYVVIIIFVLLLLSLFSKDLKLQEERTWLTCIVGFIILVNVFNDMFG